MGDRPHGHLQVAATWEHPMPDTTCHMSISLDGFVAGPDQSLDNPLGKRARSCTVGTSATRGRLRPTRSRPSGSCAPGARM